MRHSECLRKLNRLWLINTWPVLDVILWMSFQKDWVLHVDSRPLSQQWANLSPCELWWTPPRLPLQLFNSTPNRHVPVSHDSVRDVPAVETGQTWPPGMWATVCMNSCYEPTLGMLFCFLLGKKICDDYHGEMNIQHFMEWFEDMYRWLPKTSCSWLVPWFHHKRIITLATVRA